MLRALTLAVLLAVVITYGFGLAGQSALGQQLTRTPDAAPYDWQSGDRSRGRPYIAPDPARYFPANPPSGGQLDALIRSAGKTTPAPEQQLDLFRQGYSSMKTSPMQAFQWLGNQFIAGQTPQNPAAIEITYHASASSAREAVYAAVYFGLSLVDPQTTATLRAMTAAAMRTRDGDLVTRVAWAGRKNREQLLAELKPYLESPDAETQKFAEEVRPAFSGELTAEAWKKEYLAKRARSKHGASLESLRTAIADGDSSARLHALRTVNAEGVTTIMDDSFLAAMQRAAEDPSSAVRVAAAEAVGLRWLEPPATAAAARATLMKLAADPIREVRRNAFYYGLASSTKIDPPLAELTFEMWLLEGDRSDLNGQLQRLAKRDQPGLRVVLERDVNGVTSDPLRAVLAWGAASALTSPPQSIDPAGPRAFQIPPQLQTLLDSPSQILGRAFILVPTRVEELAKMPDSSDALVQSIQRAVPDTLKPQLRFVDVEGTPLAMFMVPEFKADALKLELAKIAGLRIIAEQPIDAGHALAWAQHRGELYDDR